MQAEALTTTTGQTLQGPLLLRPKVFTDDRGYFFESWNERQWQQLLTDHGQEPVQMVQENHSRSSRAVLRGLHYQLPPHPQGKVVRCVVGEIVDVMVDIRCSSPTCGQWVGTRLSAANKQQLWLPAGFAHGFLTRSEQAEVLYKTTDFWSQACERAVRWDDPALAIHWPEEGLPAEQPGGPAGHPLLAAKDAQAPSLAEALAAGDVFP